MSEDLSFESGESQSAWNARTRGEKERRGIELERYLMGGVAEFNRTGKWTVKPSEDAIAAVGQDACSCNNSVPHNCPEDRSKRPR